MITRRRFVGRGLGAVALGCLARPGWARWLPSGEDLASSGSDPVAELPVRLRSIVVNGVPFQAGFSGDDFPSAGEEHVGVPPFIRPLHESDLPQPDETVTVAVIGGGISGLTCAYLLRDLDPVLFDMHDRFGGTARGERWGGTSYSLGNAYVITPDRGSFLDRMYRELGLHDAFVLSEGDDPVEIDGTVLEDFWVNGLRGNPDEVAALAEYAEVVRFMAEESYPEIPFEEKDRDWISALDRKTLKQDIEERMSLAVPPLLESAIQGYCFSSFAAGWDRISAAGGWNFLAAEEFGRWVFPGGTSYLARSLWRKLVAASGSAGRHLLRAGSTVLDVRLRSRHVQVTWRERGGGLRSLLAERVVMACPKFACKHMMPDLAALDPQKLDAMSLLSYTPYVVANVLIGRPIERDFYDIFLLGDSAAPLGSYDPCGLPFEVDRSPVTDVLNGAYAGREGAGRPVLTLYWPLMCATARYELVFEDPWERWARRLEVQLDDILSLFRLTRADVAQVRLARWGHAMPVAAPGLIASGTIEQLRRPIEDRVYFANQDNWALPAVENCMLDAEIMTSLLRDGLGR